MADNQRTHIAERCYLRWEEENLVTLDKDNEFKVANKNVANTHDFVPLEVYSQFLNH